MLAPGLAAHPSWAKELRCGECAAETESLRTELQLLPAKKRVLEKCCTNADSFDWKGCWEELPFAEVGCSSESSAWLNDVGPYSEVCLCAPSQRHPTKDTQVSRDATELANLFAAKALSDGKMPLEAIIAFL